MLKIGEFSKLSRVSVRMLRHYDELKLLVPVTTDPFTGYRYYSEDQLPAAGKIAALKDMGFGLAAIGEMLLLEDRQRLDELLPKSRQNCGSGKGRSSGRCGFWTQPARD